MNSKAISPVKTASRALSSEAGGAARAFTDVADDAAKLGEIKEFARRSGGAGYLKGTFNSMNRAKLVQDVPADAPPEGAAERHVEGLAAINPKPAQEAAYIAPEITKSQEAYIAKRQHQLEKVQDELKRQAARHLPPKEHQKATSAVQSRYLKAPAPIGSAKKPEATKQQAAPQPQASSLSPYKKGSASLIHKPRMTKPQTEGVAGTTATGASHSVLGGASTQVGTEHDNG